MFNSGIIAVLLYLGSRFVELYDVSSSGHVQMTLQTKILANLHANFFFLSVWNIIFRWPEIITEKVHIIPLNYKQSPHNP